MGEKLLAQRILSLLREISGRNSKSAEAVLEWAADQRNWLWPDEIWAAPGEEGGDGVRIDWESLPALAAAISVEEPELPFCASVDAAATLLAFDSFERALLHVCAALERAQRLASLRMRLLGCGEDLPGLAGRLAGAATGDPAARMRRSGPVALGLVQVSSEIGGGLDVELHWRFSRLLDQGLADEEQLIGALAGARQKATLQPDDFAEHASTFDLLKRLISGALATRTGGVNILIHGPPGTGKTEFARTLVAEVGARLFAVGEADEDGEEPTRHERLHALTRAQRLLTRRHDSVLLFDEMEDLFTEASYASTGGRRAGSKIFVNRLLEGNKVPTIWTSNALDGIDPAHLRRLSFVFRMDHPSARARARIAARVAEDEGATDALDGLACLVRQEAEAGSVARAALRAAALAGGTAKDAEAVGKALLVGLRGGRALPPSTGGGTLDLDLYEADHAIGALIERLSEEAAPPDYSLLLTGPPGTGKTALAAHLAERLDRPLTVKRASDLISKWVGGTEANIADAFADAREQGSVLLFDEVDSLLLDRADARHSWEITQVNELLTWMDSHPLPFIAATNFARRLDPAALRRFVFKIELRALSPEAAERAFARFFGREAPRALARIQGLTPGDFAVVARQLHFLPDADTATILGLLEGEAAAKPAGSSRIGF